MSKPALTKSERRMLRLLFPKSERCMLQHAMRIGLEDGSLGTGESKAKLRRAETILAKLNAALMDDNREVKS